MSDMLAGMSQGGNLQDIYKQVLVKIGEYDELLDLAGDTSKAGVLKMKNILEAETKPSWQNTAENALKYIEEREDERERFGFYYGIIKTLSSKYEKEFDEYIKRLVAEQPEVAAEDKPDERTLKKALEDRKAMYNNAVTLREMALSFGQGTEEEFPVPVKRTGRSGPRGERAITSFVWSIDGVPLPKDDNSLAKIAAKYDELIPIQTTTKKKTGEVVQLSKLASLRKLIAESNGLPNLSTPPDFLTYKFTNGPVLTGTNQTGENLGEDEDEEDEDEEGEDEETTQTPV